MLQHHVEGVLGLDGAKVGLRHQNFHEGHGNGAQLVVRLLVVVGHQVHQEPSNASLLELLVSV